MNIMKEDYAFYELRFLANLFPITHKSKEDTVADIFNHCLDNYLLNKEHYSLKESKEVALAQTREHFTNEAEKMNILCLNFSKVSKK